jgi:hypothetical protein
MMKRFWVVLSSVFLLTGTLVADEGMWLFNAFPSAKVKAAYGFEPTQAWLDHLRLASVRIGGSGSFVSADGLVFTNHHVGARCIHDLSVNGKDYIKNGFYAATAAEEQKCPGMEVNVLESIEDVTPAVNFLVKPDMTDAQAAQARRAATATLEKSCGSEANVRCDVVTLYAGGLYHLYKYRQYTDVRLVFAPEFDIAFFGGDPDNFTYPRYDLDITFFRVYDNNRPVHPQHYLKWSKTPLQEGDLVFVSGHPGSTGRLNTIAQMDFLRDVQYPFTLKSLERRIALLKKFSAASAENARAAERDLFSLENSSKGTKGYQSGLLDKNLIAKKVAKEKKLRAAVANDPKKKAEYGDPWAAIEKAMQVEKEIYLDHTYLEGAAGFRGMLASYARTLVRAAAEKPKPNAERLREFRDSALPSLEQRLFSTAPIYKSLEIVQLADSLADLEEHLGSQNALLKKVLNGKSPMDCAKEWITASRLDDVAVRRQLYEEGVAAIQKSADPLIALMCTIDPESRSVRQRMEDEVTSVETRHGAAIAKILFAEQGMNTPPDATGTLRLSYGTVKSYVENGKKIPAFTTLDTAFRYAEQHGNKPPYQLPESWMKHRAQIDLNTPLNFVSTNDIIGGNSGSPVVNQNGELVGIIFDTNIEALSWRFMFQDVVGRSVSVDARAIQEALRKIYSTAALADELMNGKATR